MYESLLGYKMMKYSKFLRPFIYCIILGVIFHIVFVFHAISSWEGGSNTLYIILSPYLIFLSPIFGGSFLVMTQFSIYGVILGVGNCREKFGKYLIILIVMHILAIAAAFVADKLT